jgi:HK97 family phage prohead protease
LKGIIDFNFPLEIVKAYEEEKKDSQVQEEDSVKWIVEGLASTSDFDLSGDIIDPDAYKDAEKDLIENSTVLDNHNPDKRIGHVIECKAQDEGLWVKVLISKTAKDVWQQIKEGVLNKFSIRGRIIDAVKKYIQELGRIANVIRKMYLMECSLVSLPANPRAKTMRWYMSKSIAEFEQGGGEIPLDETTKGESMTLDFNSIVSTLDTLKDRLSAEDQKTLSEITASLKDTKYPYGYPKQKDESDEDYHKRLTKDFEEFLAARKTKDEAALAEEAAILKKKEEEALAAAEAEKALKKQQEDEALKKAQEAEALKKAQEAEALKKQQEEEAEKALKKKEEDTLVAGYPYQKKKTGETYSQEEVDSILLGFKSFVEDQLTQKDKALVETQKELRDKLDSIEKEVKTIKGENDSLKADQKVEKEWSKISDSYKEADSTEVKGILKKTFLGQALKPEEQNFLIEKKISSDLIVSSEVPVKKGELTLAQEQEIIKFSGIKPKVKKE